jgi:maltose O-acetyltransferase
MTRKPTITQKWTIKKVLCYLIYRLIAKHLPDDLGFVGRISGKLRRILCRPLFKESAKVISIGKDVDFDNGCNIIMKDHSNLGTGASLGGNYATITVGKHVMMGKSCIIISQNHLFLEEGYDGFEGKDVVIDDYAWIGHRVTILPGIRIGKHAIVGAGAVVSKDVPDYAIAVGNPAVVKKFRKNPQS